MLTLVITEQDSRLTSRDIMMTKPIEGIPYLVQRHCDGTHTDVYYFYNEMWKGVKNTYIFSKDDKFIMVELALHSVEMFEALKKAHGYAKGHADKYAEGAFTPSPQQFELFKIEQLINKIEESI